MSGAVSVARHSYRSSSNSRRKEVGVVLARNLRPQVLRCQLELVVRRRRLKQFPCDLVKDVEHCCLVELGASSGADAVVHPVPQL